MSINAVVENIVDKVFDGTLVSGLDITRSGTYTRRTESSFNPTTGGRTVSSNGTTITVIDKGNSFYYEDGVQKKARKFLCKDFTGIDFSDISNDRVTIDSLEYKVVSVKPVRMGSTDLAYEIQGGVLS
jgi:hypothetical protein